MDEVKCLPCLHSLPLCGKADCHQKALQRGVTCQQCQEVFSVPSGGFAPHPFAGRKAVSKQCEEKELFCHEDHDQPQKAVAYCPQCPGAVCDECVQAHRSMKIFKTHTTMPLSKAVSEGSITKKVAFVCVKHAEKQRLYCTECETLMCFFCHSVGDHKTHSALFVDDEIGQKNKSTLKSCIVSAEKSIDKVAGALGQVERNIDVLHRQSDNAKVEITQLINDFIAILKARQAALVGEVDRLEKRAGRELQRHKEKLSQQLSELQQFKLLTEDLLQHGIPEEQISLKKSVVERIAAITATATLGPIQPPSYSVSFNLSTTREKVAKQLSKLGSLTSGAYPQTCTVEDLPVPVDGVLPMPNMPLTFAILTRDKDSKLCQGGDKVMATLTPSTCGVSILGRVEDRGDGTYQVKFNTIPAPDCKMSITVNGGHTKGSPLMIRAHTANDIGRVVEEFRDPRVSRRFRALTVGRDGCLVATENNYKEINIFNRAGSIVKHIQVKGGGSYIEGIAEVQEGYFAISYYGKNCINVYSAANRQFVRQFHSSGHLDGPCGLAVNSKGQLFVADYSGDKVAVFNPNGDYQYSFGKSGCGSGQFNKPEQICIAPNGLVYVTDRKNNLVQVFAQDGRFVRQFGRDVLEGPAGIALTKNYHVVVASEDADKLSIFTLQGRCIREITNIGLSSPYGVAVDACGWVYVADCDNHRILKL